MPSAADIFSDLPTYATYRPTGFDPAGLALPDRQTWRVMPAGVNRDSDVRARSNWRVMAASLAAVDPTGEHHETHRFGHWGCGWLEIMIVNPDAPDNVITEAGEIAATLESYPVLSDDDYGTLEYETACATWASMGTRERIRVCVKFQVSIFAARRDELPDSPSGEIPSYLARD